MALGFQCLLIYTLVDWSYQVNANQYRMTLNLDSEMAVEKIVNRLTADGLQVMRSFDLQAARAAHLDCTCPHHGTEHCDCQMVVLLVYEGQGQPLSLVAHGKDGQTHFAIVESPEQEDDQRFLKSAVLQALAVEGFATIRQKYP